MDDQFIIEMGKRIYSLRSQLRLSQEEAAEKSNTTKQTISLVEKGKQELRAGTVVKIANALGVSTDYLLKGLPSAGDLKCLDERIGKLNKDQYGLLMDFVSKFIDYCEKVN